MNPLIVSAAIERQCGIETIPHLTPRDTTVMGLESVLLGAHAEGIRNVLAVTGDPPEVGDYPGSGGVYEVDSIGLTRLISQLNRGENYNGKAIDAPTSFFIGVAVNPNADDPELELDRFRRKVDEGAQLRDDADRLRPRRPRPVHGPARRAVAGAGARGRVPADVVPARAAAAQRGAGHRRARSRCRKRCATRGHGRRRSGSRTRAS